MKGFWISKKWSDLCDEVMSLDVIKSIHEPNDHYRFNGPLKRNVGYSSAPCGVERIIYVSYGSLEVDEQGGLQRSVIINKGEYALLPQGTCYQD